MLTKNAILLPLATTAFLIARTVNFSSENKQFYQSTLLAISLFAMLLLLLHIIKGYTGKMRNSVMFRTLSYYLICIGIILIGEHFLGNIFAIISSIIFMLLFTKMVFA